MEHAQRVHYLDNLRSIAVIGIVPYHVFRIFDWGPYYLKLDSLTSIEIISRFLLTWYMPLFFLVAGASVVYSLRKRSTFDFFRERTLRLMIPFVLGICLLMPINGYLAYQHTNGVELDFLAYLPLFLEIKSLTGYDGQFSFGHYWFLGYLGGFCLLAPTVLHHARTNSIKPIPFLLIVAVILIGTRLTLMPYPNPFNFFAFFLVGLYMYARPGFADQIYKFRNWYLGLAIITGVIFQYVRLTMGVESFSGIYWFEAVRAVNAWLWVLALLSWGRLFLNMSGPAWSWVSRHGLWIYFFHLPIVTIFAYFLSPLVSNSYVLLIAVLFFSYVFTLPLAVLGLKLEMLVSGRSRLPALASTQH